MDSIYHATRKIMIERAAMARGQTDQQQEQSEIPDVAPPAYSVEPPRSCDNIDDYSDHAGYDEDEDEDEDEDDPSPVRLTLNASTNVQGIGNMVASPALTDATRFSALLLAAVQSLNAKAEAEAELSAADGGRIRPMLNVELVINCGITVNGDRNFVGCRPSLVAPQTVAGGKRKAEEDDECERPGKRRECVE